ncbi:MAG TPA: hypothetical protein VFB25_01465 [Gaiellaceae bacterium]|nr:hypothetical protein [Gaiellaceae bacterium]
MGALAFVVALVLAHGNPAPRPVSAFGTRAADVDLAQLVPAGGMLDHVWFVPAGRGVPEIAVAWHFTLPRRLLEPGRPAARYVLTLWRRQRVGPLGSTWMPHTLVHDSAAPLDGHSVRLADVTGDGHDDLLVTILCKDCNHAVALVAVYGDVRGRVRRVYRDRSITETAWGAERGLLWFDEPGPAKVVCCPEYRVLTFLRYDAGRWRVVERRREPADGSDPYELRGWPHP